MFGVRHVSTYYRGERGAGRDFSSSLLCVLSGLRDEQRWSISKLEVDAVLQRLPAQQPAVVVDEERRDVARETQRRRVRRDDQVRRAPEDVIGWQRLGLEDIEHGGG